MVGLYVIDPDVRSLPAWKLFARHGFSPIAIDRLVSFGLGNPEELIALSERQIHLIPGIGPRYRAEIYQFRQSGVIKVRLVSPAIA